MAFELGLMINLFFTLLLKQNQGSRCTSGTGQTGQQQTRFQLGRIFHGIHFLSKGDAARRRVERRKTFTAALLLYPNGIYI